MQAIRVLIFVVYFVFNCSFVEAISTFYDARLYIDNGSTIDLAWDAQEATVDRYEVTDTCVETGEVWSYTTTGLSITIPKKRIGHHIFAVRACGTMTDNSGNSVPGCTAWSTSTDKTSMLYVNGTNLRNDGWMIYWKISPIIME